MSVFRFRLKLSKEEMSRRARLLNRAARVLSVLAIAAGLFALSLPIEKAPSADWFSIVFILITLALTALCTFHAEGSRMNQTAAICFIMGFSIAVSIAVWQFGRRVPEVHLAYFIPVALAAMLWGALPGIGGALNVWLANVLVVANQPGSDQVFRSINDTLGLLTLGASYLALAIVVGRFAENLAQAAHRAEEKARVAAEAEKQARVYADELAISLRAEQARRTELQTLYALASRLAATSKLEEFLPFTTESIVHAVNVNFAIVALFEKSKYDDDPLLRIASCHPCREEDKVEIGMTTRLSDLPTVRDALQRRTCPVLQVAHDSKFDSVEAAFLNARHLASLAIVPILSEDEPLGVVVLGEERAWEREPISDEKIQLARSISDLTAGAIQRSHLFGELEDAYVQTVLALARAVEAKDTYTADHAERLADLAERVAQKLGTHDAAGLQALRFGAMLHDVGKIGVPDSILKKPGRLDEEEWKQMRQHPAIGSRILETVARMRDAAKVVRHHHERWDGNGYPDRLAGEAIPFGARILTVVDSYSAIVDKRVYKEARSEEEAVAELTRAAGTQFDPRVVEAFLRVLEEDEGKQKAAPSVMIPPDSAEFQDLVARASVQQLEVLTRLVATMNGSFELTAILRQSAKTVVEILDAAAVGLFLYHRETDGLELVADSGLPEEIKARFVNFPVTGFHNEVVVRENRPRLHGSPSNVAEFVQIGLPQLKPDWGNYLCVPLSANGEVKGVMGIFGHGARPFDSNEVTLYCWIAKQVGAAIANAQLHAAMQKQALTDSLTGAYNRRFMVEYLKKELERCARYEHGISVLMFDIDSFKDYNDVFGHLEGDKALQELVQVLRENLRSIDAVVRYGGEEFVVILPETGMEGALTVAEKNRVAVAEHEFPCGHLTVSVGVARCDRVSGNSSEDLLALADRGLYNAKRHGRNRVGMEGAEVEPILE